MDTGTLGKLMLLFSITMGVSLLSVLLPLIGDDDTLFHVHPPLFALLLAGVDLAFFSSLIVVFLGHGFPHHIVGAFLWTSAIALASAFTVLVCHALCY